jgi:predicted GNAT superfamily acetyltransferase
VLAAGIERILWTYDPLVAANAHLNFNRLGVDAIEYVENMYGRDLSSPLHGESDTDRLVVEWRLNSPRAVWAIEEAPAAAPILTLADTPIVRPELDMLGAPPPHSEELPEEGTVRLEVPEDIVYVIEHSPAQAEDWRKVTRVAFCTYLRRGYAIRSFYRDPSTKRCFYVLRRP